MVLHWTSFLQDEHPCSRYGELLREKADGDVYSLCTAPGTRENEEDHIKCDRGTMHVIESPQFTCMNPTRTLNGQKKETSPVPLVAEMHAKYNDANGSLTYDDGPSGYVEATSVRERWAKALLRKMVKNRIGFTTPISFRAQNCMGEYPNGAGVLIEREHGSPQFEFCPAGSAPIDSHDKHYESWSCDSVKKVNQKLHCCLVRGRSVCTQYFTDLSDKSKCTCTSKYGDIRRFLFGNEDHQAQASIE
eukprot:GEMP01078535.1.p1 GENE.GEMP01078535.1~~GEMP01078535.1.p1  ORF type:complete len:247 (+),score=52.59 GEMP01078535.1:85-825(+)